MMSEAQLPATSCDNDGDRHRNDSESKPSAEKTSSIRIGEDARDSHYPTTEASASDDAVASAVSISLRTADVDGIQADQTDSLKYTALQDNHAKAKSNIHQSDDTKRSDAVAVGGDNSSSTKQNVDNISLAISAPMSVLGSNSDRSDFLRGGNSSTTENNHSKDEEPHTAFDKVKSWFAAAERDDEADSTALDYREFTSPVGKKKRPNNENITNDVEMASSTTNNHNDRRKQQYNNDEEYVMDKCSFAYGSDSPEKYKSPHRIPSIDHQYSNEGNDDSENDNTGDDDDKYFGRNYQNRRINPRAMAHAITSRAKRTWTERRYRRRLRQSQFIPPHTTTEIEMNGHSSTSPTSAVPSSFHYELTSEHRHAFLAAHAALNGKLANEHYRNRHANLREDGFDNDLQFDLEQANDNDEEVRADLTKSSLAIRGGLIRLPVDNVRLVCDEYLEPGVLSIETRDMGNGGGGTKGYEMFGNANRYGNINGNTMMRGMGSGSEDQRQQSEKFAAAWERHELAYVLTVDEHIYRRVAQEMGDANRVPFGIYFCCHETGGGSNHVGIEVAVLILLVIFLLLVAGMIAWPTW